MEVDDYNRLTDFIFDQSTPESDEETRVDEGRDAADAADAAPARDSAPRGRIIRRRARKACVACHKRSFRMNSALGRALTVWQKSAMRCIKSWAYLHELSPGWHNLCHSIRVQFYL